MTIKELQAEATRLGLDFDPKAKKAELEKLVAGAHGDETGTPHMLTEEDLENNPDLATEGLKAGEVVIIPAEGEKPQEEGQDAPQEATEGAGAQPEAQTPAEGAAKEPEQRKLTPAEDGLVEVRVKTNFKFGGDRYDIGATARFNESDAATLAEQGLVE